MKSVKVLICKDKNYDKFGHAIVYLFLDNDVYKEFIRVFPKKRLTKKFIKKLLKNASIKYSKIDTEYAIRICKNNNEGFTLYEQEI